MSKQGSTLAGVMDAFSVSISIALQYGVPLETYVAKFTNMRFDPAGMTDDADIRIASSVMDYLFRRLALDFLPYETREGLGIFTAAERAATVAVRLRLGCSGWSRTELVDIDGLAQSVPVEHAPGAARRLVDGADRGQVRHRSRRAALHELRRQDAPRRLLLRLRVLRLHQRLQLTTAGNGSSGWLSSIKRECAIASNRGPMRLASRADLRRTAAAADTYGSDQRESDPKVSQTLQFDRGMARELRAVIDAAFGDG